jgi:hypothetical protein
VLPRYPNPACVRSRAIGLAFVDGTKHLRCDLMVDRLLRNSAPPAATNAIQVLAAKVFARSPALRHRVRNAGEVADFIDWQANTFGRTAIHRSREHLWSAISNQMDSGRVWHGIEFGVAWGYATGWWLERVPASRLVTWDGFDRFTGLPRAWREHEQGTFDAGGIPPAIDDQRLTWHVGDVEDTVGATDPSRFASGGRLVLFDLDLYEPTVAAWMFVEKLIRPGDLLYFDEAMDEDERRVLVDCVLPTRNFEYIGCTSLALALVAR